MKSPSLDMKHFLKQLKSNKRYQYYLKEFNKGLHSRRSLAHVKHKKSLSKRHKSHSVHKKRKSLSKRHKSHSVHKKRKSLSKRHKSHSVHKKRKSLSKRRKSHKK